MLKVYLIKNINLKKFNLHYQIWFFYLETYNKDRAVPYCNCIDKPSEISVKYNRDISEKEYQKCLKGCVVLKGSNFNIDMLDHVLSFKGETKKVKNKMVDYNS